MDPNECYRLLLSALERRDYDAAAEHAENLAEWLERGGFAPYELKRFSYAALIGYPRPLLGQLARINVQVKE